MGLSHRIPSARSASTPAAAMEPLEPRLLLDGTPLITEFMANTSTPWYLSNPDSDWDWIEIHNPTGSPVSLDGWHLTDNHSNLTKWTFPSGTTLDAGAYRIVFASGLQDGDLAHPADLHASFKLDAGDPEYLGLVMPGGLEQDIVHEYAPTYPEQLENISYGLPVLSTVYEEFVLTGAEATYHVPTVGDDLTEWTAIDYDDSGWVSTFTADLAGLVITEIETGETDWIEIQNVSDASVDATGWSVAVNDGSSGDINDVNATVWSLSGPIASGQVLYRTDDPGEAYWGDDIDWEAGGTGWAMILDAGGEVVDFLAWGYTQAQIASLSVDVAGFTGVTVGGGWTGDGAEVGDGIGGGEPGPEENILDFGNTWNYMHPLDATDPATADPDFETTWMQPTGYDGPAFDASGEALLGYGTINWAQVVTNIGQPSSGSRYTAYFRRQVTVAEDMVDVGIELLSDDGAVIYLDGAEIGRTNISGADTYFAFAEDAYYPDGALTEDRTETLSISDLDAGTYTLAVSVHQNQAGSSDLGFDLRLFGRPTGVLGTALARTGNADSNTAADFTHTDEPTRGAPNPGLTVPFGNEFPVTTGIGYSADQPAFETNIQTDVAGAMEGVNASLWIRIPFDAGDLPPIEVLTLRMKYDAGFVAYLNGEVVAERNAPPTLAYDSAATLERDDLPAVAFEEIDLSGYILGTLQEGPNVLAIHGMNSAAADTDFLILPELVASGTTDEPQYMTTPTPGSENVEGALGFVADTRFSVDRGFYDAPFDVAITTETSHAEIFYTTDGSVPFWINPAIYTGPVSKYDGPISITTTTTLRAIGTRPGYIDTNVDTQTYIFPESVLEQDGAGFPVGWGYDGRSDYEVDPEVVDDPQYHDQFIEGLTAIPTLSLVLPVADIFGSSGLYSNPQSTTMEKQTSAELIYPDGVTEGFQVDAGLKMQGGASRNPSNAPKHSMSLRFRTIYGPGRLEFPLFENWPVDEFNSLHLRAMYNNSWIHWDSGQRSRGSLIRDQWMRDTLIAMDQIDAGNGIYVNLYINGLYWGVYNVHERQESSHYAEYNGGDEDRIDALNSGAATDGSTSAWNNLQSLVAGAAGDSYISLTEYDQITQKLDVVSLIDYMIVNHYGGNSDWDDHNWRVVGGGPDEVPWRFYSWDAERVLEAPSININKIGVNTDGRPSRLFHNLRYSEEFRMLVADRIHKHFFNGGALTPEGAAATWMARANELDLAIVGESARWGDYRRDVHSRSNGPYEFYRKNSHWLPEQNRLMTSYFENSGWNRSEVMIRIENGAVQGQYYSAGLYPAVIAPSFNQHGGEIASGFDLTMTAPSGTIWYTTDGTDPRLPGGGRAAAAVAYASGHPVPLTDNAHVKARVLSGSTWSALNEATFVLDTPPDLVVTEIMYNPADPTPAEFAAGFTDNADFEFIEIQNTGAGAVNLAGITFCDGVWFDFPSMTLAPDAFALVVRNQDAFQFRYPAVPADRIAGEFQWQSGLADTGEALGLATIADHVIQLLDVKDGWFDHTDGEGFSLVPRDPLQDDALWTTKEGWRASWQYGGNPGAADPGPLNPGDIVINELLAHSDGGVEDWVELHNTTTGKTIDLTGWFLSDTDAQLDKFALPATVLGPGDYVVFSEVHHFGAAFAFSELGDQVYLTSRAPDGSAGGYREDEFFGSSENEVSFGRYVKSTGAKDFVAMTGKTYETANSGPVIPDVVINEIMYNPLTGGHEFLELANLTAADVPLHDDEPTPNTWAFIGGVEYAFPAGSYVPANGYALVVGIDPATFRATYAIDPAVPIYGPFDDDTVLDNGGEALELARPGSPEPGGAVPYIITERIRYDDEAPWPIDTDGLGPSLERRVAGAYGNDVANWAASTLAGGTPGAANSGTPPQVVSVALNPDPNRTERGLGQIDPGGLGVETVLVTFSKDVTFLVTDVIAEKVTFDALGNETGAVSVTPESVVYGATNAQILITFTDAWQTMVDTWVRITLAETITDGGGQGLDGEPAANSGGLGYIYDAVDDLPSGDGVAGGAAVFYVGSLRADMRGYGPGEIEPDGEITPWDITGFTQKYLSDNLDADMAGYGPGQAEPDADVNPWDISGFTSRYSAAMAAGTHLEPLPTGGEGLAVGTPSPLPLAAGTAETATPLSVAPWHGYGSCRGRRLACPAVQADETASMLAAAPEIGLLTRTSADPAGGTAAPPGRPWAPGVQHGRPSGCRATHGWASQPCHTRGHALPPPAETMAT
ncbi:MAG TPA: lamin tail domain-containing protein, partial [Phycisphaerae bacterium]|nr:lamin tail domain-containing protein [Phycisphaerae bacterium]